MWKPLLSLSLIFSLAALPLAGCHRSGSGSEAQVTADDPTPAPPDDTTLTDPGLGPGPVTTNPGGSGGTGGSGNTGGSSGPGPKEQPAVPEPGTIALVGIGLAAAHLASRKRKRKSS